MKILIQGRKNGYTILYPRPTPIEFYSFASDIQSISANNYNEYYGKTFFTLAFADNGCIFTKYVIGNDIGRGQLGEIGISIFVPNTYSLSGLDIKTLLDKLIDIYSKNYIIDNKIAEPRSVFDWTLFTNVADSYDSRLRRRSPIDYNVKTGRQDPAFHYYKSEDELIDHFDNPFQEEYYNFRQIIFVDSKFKSLGNPLDVIMNSGIEVIPDLKNQYYNLVNYDNRKPLIITANGKKLTDRVNKIRSKWQIDLYYSMQDRFFHPINAHGTLSDENSEIYKYLKIEGNEVSIDYSSFDPLPKKKTIQFHIKDRQGNVFEDCNVEVSPKNDKFSSAKRVINNCHDFSDKDLADIWVVKARKGDLSGSSEFVPESANGKIEIIIDKRIIIPIIVKDQHGNRLSDYEVRINSEVSQSKDQLEFVGEQTSQYNIVILKTGYQRKNTPNFFPHDNKPFEVTLEREPTHNQESQVNFMNPHGWEKDRTSPEPVKSSLKNKKAIAIIVISIIISSAILIFYSVKNKNIKTQEEEQLTEIRNSKKELDSYTFGDSLNLKKLSTIEEQWINKQEQYSSSKAQRRSSRDRLKKDAATSVEQDFYNAMRSIKKAQHIRELIDEKNFEELKRELDTSQYQQTLKTAIEKINSPDSIAIKGRLGDISSLTITQIADSIHSIINSIESERRKEEAKKQSSKKTQTVHQQVKQKIPSTDKTAEIIKYIRGNELDVKKLNEYKNLPGINQNLKNSIQLCLDYWLLDGSSTPTGKNSKTYFSLLQKVNKDPNFDNSRLRNYLIFIKTEPHNYSDIEKRRIRTFVK